MVRQAFATGSIAQLGEQWVVPKLEAHWDDQHHDRQVGDLYLDLCPQEGVVCWLWAQLELQSLTPLATR